ncbi:Protein present in Fab1, YOTB, Vac1, and EEA1 [Rhizoctonia solani]|uniref:Protein present in Fab1, YOTB, Vac1, and EEA1 n=1 Tax=Rhizoctonia solani TaxID=456999 RepID=A0A8H7M160_9AGAM|nr:Protein present in Fab1, YOTB, Vac1, and EEA1 [Rhizoctonia solani]
MPPPSASSALHLLVLPKPFRVFKLSPSTSFPLALISILQKPPIGDEFVSITRNTDEVSVVTDHVFDQKDELGISEEGDLWRCIKVRGPMEHGLTGIMAALTAPLRDAEVPIFAISTWDTDWLLVGLNKLEKAIEALRADGESAKLFINVKWIEVMGKAQYERQLDLVQIRHNPCELNDALWLGLHHLINPYSDDLLSYHDTGLAGGFAPLQKHEACYAKWRPHFSTLNLARSSDSSTPSTPKSSYIANLPPESPTSPLAPRSPSPAGRNSQTPSTSRPPSQLRIRDSQTDSVASIFSVDSVKEHDENESPSQPNGQASASLPTDSSLPDLGLPLPPPIPASRTPLSSSPSRRVVIIAPPAASNVPSTPSRSRRTLLSKPLAEEKVREREEKRRRIAKELLDTEQSYVDGLDLVYNHFLAPLIESLATAPHPLVTPADLGVIFPGFIDILNFNRSFLSELRSILTPHLVTRSVPIPIPGSNPSSTSLISQQQPVPISSASSRPSLPNEAGTFIPHEPSTSWNSRLHLTSESQASLQLAASAIGFPLDDSSSIHARGASTASENTEPTLLPSLVTVLAQHVPYLRLYKPFVTGFPASMERLAKLSANESFRIWLKEREKDPACGMLGLRSWLLSIVQRCPRYLLLVKDLEKSSDEADEGYKELSSVLALLTKITNALNTSLADHTAVLALLDLQRSTSSLPPGFSFVAPGRSLIRRGRLRMSGQEVSQGGVMRRVAGTESERELLLFSDCVVWLERELEWGWSWEAESSLEKAFDGTNEEQERGELPTLKSQNMGLGMTPETMRSTSGSSSAFVTRETPAKRESPPKRPSETPDHDGRQYLQRRALALPRGNLMDVEVVVSPRNAMQIDFLSPEGSFALYASQVRRRTYEGYSKRYRILPEKRRSEELENPARLGGVYSEEEVGIVNPGRTAFAKQSRSEKQKERRVGSSITFLPYGFPTGRPMRACAVRLRLAGEGDGIIVGFVAGLYAPLALRRTFSLWIRQNPMPPSRKPERACTLCYEAAERGARSWRYVNLPPPRILEHLVSTSPITTPAIERPMNGALEASPSSPTMLTLHLAPSLQITSSTTERTIRSLDSQRTVQPHVSMASDLSSMTSASISISTTVTGCRQTVCSGFSICPYRRVTARSKVIGKGKGRRCR